MEQLVILVIIGLISLVNWALKISAEKREAAKAARSGSRQSPTPPPLPTRPHPSQTQRAPMRELLEALGLPADAPPPLPVPAPRVPVMEEEFASMEETTPRPAIRVTKPPTRRTQSVRLPDQKTLQLASAFAAQEKAADETPHLSAVRALLAGQNSKRHAIILSEILGSPRALRPLEVWG